MQAVEGVTNRGRAATKSKGGSIKKGEYHHDQGNLFIQ